MLLDAARAPRTAIFLAARALATRRLVGMVAAPAPARVSPVATSKARAPAPTAASPGQMRGWGAGAARLERTRQLRATDTRI